MHLRDAVAECDLLDWFGRVKLIDCICEFVLLSPQIGQVIIFQSEMILRLMIIF